MGTQEEKELVCPLVNRVGEPAESSRLRLMVVVTVPAPSHGKDSGIFTRITHYRDVADTQLGTPPKAPA